MAMRRSSAAGRPRAAPRRPRRAVAALLSVPLALGLVPDARTAALCPARPPRQRVARSLVVATATRMPPAQQLGVDVTEGFARAVDDAGTVLMPEADAEGWCLGRESVEAALDAMRRGEPVVVTDDADRENEGDLIFAAETATAETLAFTVRHTSGVICVAMPGERLDELRLGPMVARNEDPKGTAFAVSVDLLGGDMTTGISASDRARTLRALADPQATADKFCRPGHLFPLRARPGGTLERGGHTEASVDLARLAGLAPAGALCEIVRDEDGEMARWDDLGEFAKTHNLAFTTIADIQQYRRSVARDEYADLPKPEPYPLVLERGTMTRMPTAYGDFDAVVFADVASGLEHVALLKGDLGELANADRRDIPRPERRKPSTAPPPSSAGGADGAPPVPLVRVHSECATGDIFGSKRCDCGEQLQRALRDIHAADAGVLLYLRGHEGRGIGLGAKLQAYGLQDRGRDTVDANTELGHAVDGRDYVGAAAMLRDLGLSEVKLLTNNPAKVEELEKLGVTVVERVPVLTTPNEENYKYLLTKQKRMGHDLGLSEDGAPGAP